MKNVFVILLLMVTLFVQNTNASAFLEHENGQPYVWKPNGSPILYKVETGDLTASVDNTQAKALIAQAFSVWQDVFGAQEIVFSESMSSLGIDVNLSNYKNYIDLDFTGQFKNKTSDTVVIFDRTGEIVEDLFEGVAPGSGSSILGIASPGLFNKSNLEILAGFVLINGAVTESDTDTIKATATHELGHLLNLAHTQLNTDQAKNVSTVDDDVVPTMFPFIPTDASVSDSLELEDQFSMSLLYPDSTEIDTRNEIRGHIVRKNGEGVRAVNVTCRDNADPLKNAVTYLSDQSELGDGNYVCGLLPAGDYTVEIEPVTEAINVYDPSPPFINTEFYNAVDEGFDAAKDFLNESSLVSLTGAGNSAEDIDIVLNNNGRLFSGQTISSQTLESFAVKEFYINVPSGADKLTVNLNWQNNAKDLDLFVKCLPEFSIAGAAASLYQQSDAFSDDVFTNTESIVLSKGSNPKLKKCAYHIMVQKFNPSVGEVVNFTLSVDVDGASPRLKSKAEDINKWYQSNEYIAASKVLSGDSEAFDIYALEFTESILTDFSTVTLASLYLDSNKNGKLDNSDTLLKTTSNFDDTTLKFAFNDISFSVLDQKETQVFITYTFLPVQAQLWNPYVMFFLLIVALLCLLYKKSMRLFFVLVLMSVPFSCHKKIDLDYKPILIDANSVTAVGETFNDEYTVDIDESGRSDSVKDFFD